MRNLRIGSLPLGFDPSITEYAVATTNASNTISATSDYPVTITVNGEPHANSTPYSWHDGDNTVVVAVEGGLTYTAIVTK